MNERPSPGETPARRRKTQRTAVVAIPPDLVWEPIQAIRRVHDRQIDRWMPHVTLLYPFRPRAEFDRAAMAVEEACAALSPFTVTLSTFERFRHDRASFTMWLDPQPAEPIRQLREALAARFPDCDDTAEFPSGFTPHLSVGQVRGEGAVEAVMDGLRKTWAPVSFEIAEVALIARDERGPFRVERRVPLGAARERSPRARSTS